MRQSKFPAPHKCGICDLERLRIYHKSAAPVSDDRLLWKHPAFDDHFRGPVRLTQLAVPIFRRQRFGRVIYLSSAATLLHEPDMAAYNASKAASEAYFLTLADELKRSSDFRGHDIDVTVLRLSFVKSDYEPKVQVAESVGADRRAFVRVMSFLRNHSPTTAVQVQCQ